MHSDLILDISKRLDEQGFFKQSECFYNKQIKNASKNDSGIKKTIVSTKHMKDGFEIRKEIWDGGIFGSSDIEMETIYNHHGDYIGDKKTALLLIKKGIVPEISKPDHSVCSIGYCPKDGKWYGWSHRAMKGFGIGDKGETWSPYISTKSKEKIQTLVEAKQAAVAFAESVS